MDTKKLRQKILDLAIRGKLVPQDPNDEPASVLLERIRAEKECLIKEGKIKRSKKSASDDNIEAPFEIPESWAIAKYRQFVTFTGGSQPPKDTFEYEPSESNIRLIQIRDYKTDKFITYIPKTKARRFCSKTDVMIGRYGPPIFQILRGIEGAYNVALMKAEADGRLMSKDYLFYLLQEHKLLELLESISDRTCGQDGVNVNVLNDYVVGIPPIEEQKRIVNAVERSFAVIDALETNEADLLKAIDQAKSKILDLAIHGKLVPQDPSDEPAIELLKRINPKFEPCDEEKYEGILDTWCTTHLGNICFLTEGVAIADREYPYIDVKGIRTGSFTTKQSGKHIKQGTTLILVDGENSGEVFRTPIDGYQGSTLKILNINKNVNSKYILLFIRLNQKALRENKVGSAIPHLNKKMFRELTIPIPPYQEQLRIVTKIEEFFAVLDGIKETLA